MKAKTSETKPHFFQYIDFLSTIFVVYKEVVDPDYLI